MECGGGDDWQEKVDDTLSNIAFFIPVITPRFFRSVACRGELTYFSGKAERLGVTELIMPLLYIDVPELYEEEPSDPLVALVKTYNWKRWIDLRFADRQSGEYRQSVNALAQELAGRVDRMDQPDVVAAMEANAIKAVGDEDPGSLDRLALMEESMPRWVTTTQQIGEAIRQIGDVMARGTESMQSGKSSGKGYAARLTVAKRVAHELNGLIADEGVVGV